MSKKKKKKNINQNEQVNVVNVEEKTNKKEEKLRIEKERLKKEKLKNILMVVSILLIIGLFIFIIMNKSDPNHIKEISYSKYEEVIKSDEYTIVLLASPTCSHCFSFKPLMNQVLDERNLKAYYVDVSALNREQIIYLHDNINALVSQFDEDGYPVIPTPTTIIFKNGKEIDSKSGNMGYDGFLNFLVRNGVV